MVHLSGMVFEAWSRQPIRTALVNVNGIQTMTDENGRFSIDVQGAIAAIQVLHRDHETLNVSIPDPYHGEHIELQMKPIGRAL